MSEKRFVACDKWADSEGNIFRFVVIDTKVFGDKQFILRCNHWSQAQDICNRLNDTLDELREENEQLRQSVEYWQRKRVEKASEIQKECFKIKDIRIEKKYCGSCKHLHLDGMFDFWCDENHDWTLVNGNCSDFER